MINQSSLLVQKIALARQNHLQKKTEWARVRQCQGRWSTSWHQVILETEHCRSFSDVWRQSIPRSGRTYSKSFFPPGKMKGTKYLGQKYREAPSNFEQSARALRKHSHCHSRHTDLTSSFLPKNVLLCEYEFRNRINSTFTVTSFA